MDQLGCAAQIPVHQQACDPVVLLMRGQGAQPNTNVITVEWLVVERTAGRGSSRNQVRVYAKELREAFQLEEYRRSSFISSAVSGLSTARNS